MYNALGRKTRNVYKAGIGRIPSIRTFRAIQKSSHGIRRMGYAPRNLGLRSDIRDKP